jgi:hypothetical protein
MQQRPHTAVALPCSLTRVGRHSHDSGIAADAHRSTQPVATQPTPPLSSSHLRQPCQRQRYGVTRKTDIRRCSIDASEDSPTRVLPRERRLWVSHSEIQKETQTNIQGKPSQKPHMETQQTDQVHVLLIDQPARDTPSTVSTRDGERRLVSLSRQTQVSVITSETLLQHAQLRTLFRSDRASLPASDTSHRATSM